MGCCCSVDEDIVRADRSASNPLEPHSDWAAKLVADVGNDVMAVPRDFPRMKVVLRDPDQVESGDCAAVAEKVTDVDALACSERIAALRDTVIGIARLCNEDDSIGGSIREWWSQHRNNTSPEIRSLFEQPDANPFFRRLIVDAGLVKEVPTSEHIKADEEAESEWTREPIQLLRDNASSSANPRQYASASTTFRILEYLVQGVVFFPVQRIHYLLWFPWSTRLTDKKWTSFVFQRAKFPEHIYLVHRQTSCNYVEEASRSNTPSFEYDWDLVITLNAQSGDFVCADIQVTRCVVTHKRLGGGICDCGSNAALYDSRVEQLQQRLMDTFRVELEK